MGSPQDFDSTGFSTTSSPGATGGFDLADPEFRFPVKTSRAAHSPLAEKSEAQPRGQLAEVAAGPFKGVVHPAQRVAPDPHFQVLPIDQFVGWSVEDVDWTIPQRGSSVETPVAHSQAQPKTELSLTEPKSTEESTCGAPETASPVGVPQPLSGRPKPSAVGSVPSEITVPARPVELPHSTETGMGGLDWPVSSREQVSGFSIQRTRIEQPQVLVTGAGLAAGHRRWAARNLSAELQARTVGGNAPSNSPADSAADGQQTKAAQELTRLQRASLLGGGLPLLVHPDFRWSAMVNKLCSDEKLCQQMLQIAEQLLDAGNGRMLLAGSRRREGTTTLANLISRLLINRGQRVLMIDADLARAGWTNELELTGAGSWVSQVESFEPLQAAMAISRSTNATAVALQPVGSRKQLPPFLLDYLGQLLKPFQNQFDAMVIDVGPISQLLEELSQPVRLGSALLIVQAGGPDAELDLRRAKTTLNAFGINRLAVARKSSGADPKRAAS